MQMNKPSLYGKTAIKNGNIAYNMIVLHTMYMIYTSKYKMHMEQQSTHKPKVRSTTKTIKTI